MHDLSADSAAGFRCYLEQSGAGGRVTVHRQRRGADPRPATWWSSPPSPAEPHVSDPSWFEHNPLVLHVSLRDLAPEVLLASANIVDDVEHCLRAGTSPHLAEQLTGNRDFLHGTLDDVMAGRVTRAGGPAGGVLPLRPGGARPRGRQVRLRQVVRSGELHVVDDFFHELRRYG